MNTKAFRHLWGYPIVSDDTFRQIRDDGYVGIETGLLGIQRPEAFQDSAAGDTAWNSSARSTRPSSPKDTASASIWRR